MLIQVHKIRSSCLCSNGNHTLILSTTVPGYNRAFKDGKKLHYTISLIHCKHDIFRNKQIKPWFYKKINRREEQ